MRSDESDVDLQKRSDIMYDLAEEQPAVPKTRHLTCGFKNINQFVGRVGFLEVILWMELRE